MKCERCGSDENIIHHHVKYLELHDIEEIILLCKSCHQKLHNKLRRDNKCGIFPDDLNTLSYNSTNGKHRRYEYGKINVSFIRFDDYMIPGIFHREKISYNKKTGNVYVSCFFDHRNQGKIFNMYIGE